jgi:hypothetical protein
LAPALLAKIKLEWKLLIVANTLTYDSTDLIKAVERLMKLAPGYNRQSKREVYYIDTWCNVIKLFTAVIYYTIMILD